MAEEKRATLVIDLSTEEGRRQLEQFGRAMDQTADTSEEAIGRIDKQLEQLARTQAWRELATGLGSIALGVKGIALGIDEQIAGAAEYASAIQKWADAVGATAEQMEALVRIGAGAGLDEVFDVGDLINEIGVKAYDAARGSEDLQQTFRALGVQTLDVQGNMRSSLEVFTETVDRLVTMRDATLAMAIADELLSDDGKKLVADLRSRETTLSALLETQSRQSRLTDEGRAALVRYTEATARLEAAERDLEIQTATATAPAVARFKEELAELIDKATEASPALGAMLGLTKENAGAFFETAKQVIGLAAALKYLGVVVSGSAVVGALRVVGQAGAFVAGGAAIGAVAEYLANSPPPDFGSLDLWFEGLVDLVKERGRQGAQLLSGGGVAETSAGDAPPPDIGAPPNFRGPGMAPASTTQAEAQAQAQADAAQRKEAADRMRVELFRRQLEHIREMARLHGEYQTELRASDMLSMLDEAAEVGEARAAGLPDEEIARLRGLHETERLINAARMAERLRDERARSRELQEQALRGSAQEEVSAAGLLVDLADSRGERRHAIEQYILALEQLQSALVQTHAPASELLRIQLDLKRAQEELKDQSGGLAEQLVMASGNAGAVQDVLMRAGSNPFQSRTGSWTGDAMFGAVQGESSAAVQAIVAAAVSIALQQMGIAAGDLTGAIGG